MAQYYEISGTTDTKDARLAIFNGGSSWPNVRDATTANNTSTTAASEAFAVSAYFSSPNYNLARSFFAFDVSSITTTVTAASLKIVGRNATDSVDFILVKASGTTGNASTQFVNTDYDKIDGIVAGATMQGNVTDYSSVYDPASDPWNTTAHNVINLNSSAFTDIENLNDFIFVAVSFDDDYKNIAPGSFRRTGVYYSEDLTRYPILVVTASDPPPTSLTQSTPTGLIADDFTFNRYNVECLSVQYTRLSGSGAQFVEQVPFILGTPGPASLRRGSFANSEPPIVKPGDKKN